MKQLTLKFSHFIIPLIVTAWGIFNLCTFDPFYSKSSDPEFPYLVNGLNCATFNFNRIGHIDHPGTPFQIFNGIIINITHVVSGKGDIYQDVFARPEHYLNAISFALTLVQASLILAIGFIGYKRRIAFWQIAILQSSCFFNDVLMWLFSRVTPDRFFMIIALIFILVYLKHGYENRSSWKFALWSGTVMALGLATKFNYIPILILPLLFITTNKNRLIYVGSGIVSFFIFILPIINKFVYYRRFLVGIFKHDGLYGGGDTRVINLQKMMANVHEIFRLNPELFLLILALVVLSYFSFRRRKQSKEVGSFSFFFVGFLLIILFQIVMVSKHFKNYYLVPTFTIYGFMFFNLSVFLAKLITKKKSLILASSVLPLLFFTIMIGNVSSNFSLIKKEIVHREKILKLTQNEVSKNDFWFVEPTWESAPYPENALVYGLSYCARKEAYLPFLMNVNPNIITYEGDNNNVKFWRIAPANLDSILIAEKNVFIYSTPGRNAPALIQILQNAATRNNLLLNSDTVYSNNDTNTKIIKFNAKKPSSDWSPQPQLNLRQNKIEGYIQTIKNTPDWLSKVELKSQEKGISLDSMILLDATWMVDNE
jgi:hypothetical protein